MVIYFGCPLFYDESKIALMPMGFCYPGEGKGGDLPLDRCALYGIMHAEAKCPFGIDYTHWCLCAELIIWRGHEKEI